jgi:hypothetical protein
MMIEIELNEETRCNRNIGFIAVASKLQISLEISQSLKISAV